MPQLQASIFFPLYSAVVARQAYMCSSIEYRSYTMVTYYVILHAQVRMYKSSIQVKASSISLCFELSTATSNLKR